MTDKEIIELITAYARLKAQVEYYQNLIKRIKTLLNIKEEDHEQRK